MNPSIPFSYFWQIKRKLEESNIQTILDLGCGKGEFGDILNKENRYNIVGVDVFKPYLDECRKKGLYRKLIKKDLSKINFKEKSFDAVICLQTIEHLSKKDGQALIKKIEKIANKLIIVSTPLGECQQEAYDQNKHQAHISSWLPEEFIRKAYRVYGVGLKLAFGSHSHAGEPITLLQFIPYGISFLFNPIVSFYPKIAAQIIAVKKHV